MSFEGYYRVLCKNGHLDEFDCYSQSLTKWTCPECGEKDAWYQLIDQTNCSGQGQVWPLEVVSQEKDTTCKEGYLNCPKCRPHTPTIYQIPDKKQYEYVWDEYEIEIALEHEFRREYSHLKVLDLEVKQQDDHIVAIFSTMPKPEDLEEKE